jgi:protein gp37
MTGCTRVSPGCDHCYAETIVERFPRGFPRGFSPTFKPDRLGIPARWREPRRVFVNSMSDVHHPDFTAAQVDAVYDAMSDAPHHDYLLLTKRPARMAEHLAGPSGWLARRGLDQLPDCIWVGTSIESDRWTFRADHLRRVPAATRFLSCEPLLGPLPSLDLDGIDWVIVGGESGPGWRPMDHQWARDLKSAADTAGAAFFFKQSAGWRTELGIELDGALHEAFPHPHPASRIPVRDV